MAKRKQVYAYNDEYLKLGFTLIEVNGKVRPQCVLCLTVLAHSSLKETKLRRHLESNHGNFVNKFLEVFKEKEHQVKRSRIDRPTALGGIIYSHSSLKETKLRRHLESNHGNFVNKSLEVFKEKEHQVKRSCIDRPTAWGGIIYSHGNAVRASFAVAWKIARAKAPHTAGENLIKPASVEMARIMCGDAVAKKLEMVP